MVAVYTDLQAVEFLDLLTYINVQLHPIS